MPRHLRRRTDAVTCAAGFAVTGIAAAFADQHPHADRRLFAFINHHGDEPALLRLPQQMGTPWTLPGTAVVALVAQRRRLALAAALALPVEKAFEVRIKKARPVPRPLYVEPTVLRDDAPVEGESFPSGHAAIAFTTACLVGPYVPLPARFPLFAMAAAASLIRVSQGAHHPVDVLGGAGMGVAIAAGLRFVTGC